jgi:thiol-disulfide isomerase/thioredoxin
MRSVHSLTLLGCLGFVGSAPAAPPPDGRVPTKHADRPAKGISGDLTRADGSTAQVTLRSATVELETKYGRLVIPVADIERIEFAFRLPEDVAQKIAAAVGRLANDAFEERETASKELREIGARAYPALQVASKTSDAEVARRAALLMSEIRAKASADDLKFPKKDRVQTADITASGRITSEALRVQTWFFGEADLKLVGLRAFQTGGVPGGSGAEAGSEVGKAALEIDGEDIDGKRFKLSGHRGKVVLLVFWGHWCGPCRATYPHMKSLVTKQADMPLVVLGVNSDRDRDALKKIVVDQKITWRSFWNGGSTGGPISTEWGVRAWPTLVLIDHRGVIRNRWVGSPQVKTLEETIETLIKEAEGRK